MAVSDPSKAGQSSVACAEQIIAFTDADCRPDPGWLAAIAAIVATAVEELVGGRAVPESHLVVEDEASESASPGTSQAPRECASMVTPSSNVDEIGKNLDRHVASQAKAFYKQFLEWTQENELRWAGVGFDIEPDFRELQQATGQWWQLLPTVFQRIFDRGRLRRRHHLHFPIEGNTPFRHGTHRRDVVA